MELWGRLETCTCEAGIAHSQGKGKGIQVAIEEEVRQRVNLNLDVGLEDSQRFGAEGEVQGKEIQKINRDDSEDPGMSELEFLLDASDEETQNSKASEYSEGMEDSLRIVREALVGERALDMVRQCKILTQLYYASMGRTRGLERCSVLFDDSELALVQTEREDVNV